MLSNRPFDDLWIGPGPSYALKKLIEAGAYGGSRPKNRLEYRMNVDDDALHLTVDVPGVKADDIEVENMDGNLTIRTKRGDTDQSLSLRINDDFDIEQLVASLELGVLTIDVPRRPKPEPRRIRVSVRE